jgi:hypothetical protein
MGGGNARGTHRLQASVPRHHYHHYHHHHATGCHLPRAKGRGSWRRCGVVADARARRCAVSPAAPHQSATSAWRRHWANAQSPPPLLLPLTPLVLPAPLTASTRRCSSCTRRQSAWLLRYHSAHRVGAATKTATTHTHIHRNGAVAIHLATTTAMASHPSLPIAASEARAAAAGNAADAGAGPAAAGGAAPAAASPAASGLTRWTNRDLLYYEAVAADTQAEQVLKCVQRRLCPLWYQRR